MKQNVVPHVIVPEKGNAFPKIHRCFGSVILYYDLNNVISRHALKNRECAQNNYAAPTGVVKVQLAIL
jgi:hypothetical protein